MKKLLALLALCASLFTAPSATAATLNVYCGNLVSNWGDDNVFLSINIYNSHGFVDTTGPIIAGTFFWMEFFHLSPDVYTFDFFMDGPFGFGSHTATVDWNGYQKITVFVDGDWSQDFHQWTVTAFGWYEPIAEYLGPIYPEL